ncbi:hypothetical protein Dimus_039209 [Dionaea muscipula]
MHVLLPKKPNANKVEDFRPIACCNVLYKVIAKVIASRLGPVLLKIIDHAQAAFIKGRLMVENIYLVQELLRRYTRKRISPRCAFKVDLRKGVSWEFLEGIMRALHFPDRFIHWILLCVRTTSFSISINGCLSGYFEGKKELRQGDPLTPYFFVICLEFLSRSLNGLRGNRLFAHHPKCKQLKITHLAFANDLILVTRADVNFISLMLEKLNEFTDRSGLGVSVGKSSFFCAGVPIQLASWIEEYSGFHQGTWPF